MQYTQEQIRESNEIIAILLSGQALTKHQYKEYHYALNTDYSLKELVEFSLNNYGMRLLRGSHAEDSFFVTPGINNKAFGWKNEDVRKALNVKNNKEMYTCYFIMYVILVSFFKETGSIVAKDYISAGEVVERVTAILEGIELKSIAEEEEMDESFMLIKEFWDEKKTISTEQSTTSNITTTNGTTKYHFANKTLNFMERENLLRENILEATYSPTERFQAVVADFYSEKDIKNELLELIEY